MEDLSRAGLVLLGIPALPARQLGPVLRSGLIFQEKSETKSPDFETLATNSEIIETMREPNERCLCSDFCRQPRWPALH